MRNTVEGEIPLSKMGCREIVEVEVTNFLLFYGMQGQEDLCQGREWGCGWGVSRVTTPPKITSQKNWEVWEVLLNNNVGNDIYLVILTKTNISLFNQSETAN